MVSRPIAVIYSVAEDAAAEAAKRDDKMMSTAGGHAMSSLLLAGSSRYQPQSSRGPCIRRVYRLALRHCRHVIAAAAAAAAEGDCDIEVAQRVRGYDHPR